MKPFMTTRALFGILTIGFVFAGQVQAQSFLTNGLVAYYPFNGNANDASEHGNNGIAQNVMYATDRFGMPSSAAQFSGQLGTNSTIDCPSLDSLPYLPATYSCWFRLDGYTIADGEVTTLVGRDQANSPQIEGAIVFVSSEHLGFSNKLTYTTSVPLNFNTFKPSTNRWYHCVLTIELDGFLSLFIDGSVYGTVKCSPSSLAGAVPLPFRIGASTFAAASTNTGAPRYCWQGAIDDVRVYNRPLSVSEVQQLFAYESMPPVTVQEVVKSSSSDLTQKPVPHKQRFA
ncbi:MAG TPA: LamG domain-containing protein [Verrucomicrobiae bacterium]|nr:LamG domain-containing protein [Verrucomicrobiae bacterium]